MEHTKHTQQDESAAQKKYLELQIIDQQLRLIQQQLDQIDQQMLEISTIFESLDEMKLAKDGEDILVPLVNGVFLKAKLTDSNNMLVNVGSGSLVSKTNAELKSLLEKQLAQLTNYKDNMMATLQNLYNEADRIEQSINN